MTSSNGNILPRHWPFVRGIHRPAVNSPHKGQWRGALIYSLIYAWIYGRVNNREAGYLRRYSAYYDVTVMHYCVHPVAESFRLWLGYVNFSTSYEMFAIFYMLPCSPNSISFTAIRTH